MTVIKNNNHSISIYKQIHVGGLLKLSEWKSWKEEQEDVIARGNKTDPGRRKAPGFNLFLQQ